jgi:hypothetical protein
MARNPDLIKGDSGFLRLSHLQPLEYEEDEGKPNLKPDLVTEI